LKHVIQEIRFFPKERNIIYSNVTEKERERESLDWFESTNFNSSINQLTLKWYHHLIEIPFYNHTIRGSMQFVKQLSRELLRNANTHNK